MLWNYCGLIISVFLVTSYSAQVSGTNLYQLGVTREKCVLIIFISPWHHQTTSSIWHFNLDRQNEIQVVHYLGCEPFISNPDNSNFLLLTIISREQVFAVHILPLTSNRSYFNTLVKSEVKQSGQ